MFLLLDVMDSDELHHEQHRPLQQKQEECCAFCSQNATLQGEIEP